MKRIFLLLAALALTAPALAQDEPQGTPSPGEIVNAAPQADWRVIAPEDLLVMTLAPAADGTARHVVIQLMPPPFSQGWVKNIRTLARAGWYDGVSVNRVQDNYVVQWGDPADPDAGETPKPLPEGLKVIGEDEYATQARHYRYYSENGKRPHEQRSTPPLTFSYLFGQYAGFNGFSKGWPVAGSSSTITFEDRNNRENAYAYYRPDTIWPIHCYGAVGVGRGMSPDTGTGAELYTVIGHAPRHLDRNIAVVGRVIEGIEHLSSLPRGKGPLGFYLNASKRVPIASIRVASDLPEGEQPRFEYLDTESEAFAKYADARANRRDPFFIAPAGGADICNIPVPVRRFTYEDAAAD